MIELTKRLIQLQIDEAQALLRLRAVTRIEDLTAVMVEVDRRQAMFMIYWACRIQGHDCTPRCAALQSVCNDVMRGWM